MTGVVGSTGTAAFARHDPLPPSNATGVPRTPGVQPNKLPDKGARSSASVFNITRADVMYIALWFQIVENMEALPCSRC